MSFLHGVLHNIKPHLGQHNDKIQKAISLLEANKHSGKDGFNNAIGAVVKGVKGYNEGVEKSNNLVKNPIEALMQKMKRLQTQVSNILRDNVVSGDMEEAVKAVNQQVAECKKSAEGYAGDMKRETRNVEDLQKDLQTKIANVNSFIAYHCSLLSDIHSRQQTQRKAMESAISRQLQGLGRTVKSQITMKVMDLVKQLKQKVEAIFKELQRIDRDLREYVEELQRWINSAESLVQDALNKVNFILAEADMSTPGKYTQQIKEAAENIGLETQRLFEAGNAANEAVKRDVTAALGEVKLMDGILKNDLHDVRTALQTGLDTYVRKYVEAVQTKVKEIKGDEKSGLTQVVAKVKTYIKKFTKGKQQFEGVVKEWIGDILKMEPVKGWLQKYYEDNVGRFQLPYEFIKSGEDDTLHTAIKKLIVEQIEAKVPGAFESFEVQDAGSIGVHVTSAKRICNLFADKLGGHIKDTEGELFEDTAKEIEKTLTGNTDANQNLQIAVGTILCQLVSTARHNADAVESFTGEDDVTESDIKKVEASLGVASDMDTAFEKALIKYNEGQYSSTEPFKPSSPAAQQLTANIHRTIEKQLNDTIGEAGSGETGAATVTLPTKRFSGYRGHVDTSSLTGKKTALTGDKGAKEGSLPQAIGEVQRGVNDALSQIGNIYSGLQGHASNVRIYLHSLCSTLEGAAGKEPEQQKDSVKAKLNELKDMIENNGEIGTGKHIQKGLQKIKDDISKLQSDLASGPLQNAQEFLKKPGGLADDLRNKTIDELTKHVNEQVQKAENDFIAHSKKQYVEAIETLIIAFADKVTEELEELPGLIEHDEHIGVKGFMRKMETEFTKKVESIHPIHQTSSSRDTLSVSQAADVVNKAFGYLFFELQKQEDFKSDYEVMKPSKECLFKLLNLLTHSQHFDHKFADNLTNLQNTLNDFAPKKFHTPNSTLLDALRSGMAKFTEQLSHAYVNAYSGRTFTQLFDTKQIPNPTEPDAAPTTSQVLSTEGRNCAKVCLTILETLNSSLGQLRRKCKNDWKGSPIHLGNGNKLGAFFQYWGYIVSKEKNGHEGELRNKDGFTGQRIYSDLLVYTHNAGNISDKFQLVKDEDDDKQKNKEHGVVKKLVTYFRAYYYVTHLEHIASPKSPSNVNQMLQWMLGLYYNPMFAKLGEHFKELFEKPKGQEAKPYEDISDTDLILDATTNITPTTLKDTLRLACLYSEDVLIAFQGHGDASGTYACDFYTNQTNFLYPTSPAACFDMLVDILFRVCYQVRFVYKQCNNGPKSGGWEDCWYGQDIGGSSWNCNSLQCANQTCNLTRNQRADQSGNQICNQSCDQHPKCGLKSPLQSYLEDGLQGFLPHQFKTPGCKLTCTLTNHNGIPCKTPMGFADISNVASHTKNGAHLRIALHKFCGTHDSPLSKLCGQLNCLLGAAPKTLGDMFAFYYNFLNGWKQSGPHRKDAFSKAVTKANFGDSSKTLEVTSIFENRDHTDGHNKGDLFSLCCKDTSNVKCGRYIQPLSHSTWFIFSDKNAGKYLTWFVYLTQTFYDLLEELLKECNSKCGVGGYKCYEKCCPQECQVKKAYESKDSSTELNGKKHTEDCKSIAHCPTTRPILNKYGFVFWSPWSLSGQNGDGKKRSCKDFCNALENILNKKKADKHVLAELVFETIPEFLWKIRLPFTYLLLALWSLSLLYLLHIAVVRLDVLRIRSHLRSPASHRIAAQSLLAAARIRALANDARGKALDDIDARRISLGQLAGQLSGLIGGGQEVKDAIKNGIDIIINKYPEVKSNSKPSSPKPHDLVESTTLSKEIKSIEEKKTQLENEIAEHKRQQKDSPVEPSKLKSLDELTSKLKSLHSLQELEQYSQKLDTHKNNTQDLLKNLTEGLEKFLGFNPTSKGYTGEGIVYSDLDRLCDGVMSFLHGVLESVKDDESVTTYDNKMSVDRLNVVLPKLQESIGKGHSVFSTQIKQVGDWLNHYDQYVAGSTFLVTSELGRLMHDLGDKHFISVSGKDNVKLQAQLANWTQVVKDIESDVHTMETQHISKLNNKLKNNILHEIKVIVNAVWLLKQSAENDVFKQQASYVDNKLVEEKKKLDNAVRKQSQELRRKMGEQLRRVDGKIIELTQAKSSHFGRINDAIAATRGAIENEFGDYDTNFKNKILKCFDDIRDKVNESYNNLVYKKSELANLVSGAWKQFEVLKEKVKRGSGGPEDKSIEYNWSQLQMQIRGLVNQINGNGYSSEGIKGIIKGVINYAGKFSGRKFDGVVDGWIKKIVCDKIVSNRLGEYWKHNQNQLRRINLGQLQDAVKERIKVALNNEISQSGKLVDVTPNDITEGSIAKNVASLSRGIDDFVRGIESKHTYPGIDALVQELVQEIEQRFGVREPRAPGYSPTHLQDAVESALAALNSTARQVKEELEAFTSDYIMGYNLGTNVDDAIANADKIKEQFEEQNATYGKHITNALANVTQPIKQLDSALDKSQFGLKIDAQFQDVYDISGGKTPLGLGSPIKFDTLLTSFKQGGLDGKSKNKKDELNETIKEIRSQVSSALDKALKSINDNTLEQAYTAVTKNFATLVEEVSKLVDKSSGNSFASGSLHKRLEEINELVNNYTKEKVTWANDEKVYGLTKIKGDIKSIIGTDIAEAPNNLTRILNDAGKFYTDVVDKEAANAIADIKEYVEKEVNRVTKTVHAKAKDDYYQKITALFKETHKTVENEITTINRLIKDDMSSGVKGFLRKMKHNICVVQTHDTFASLAFEANKLITRLIQYVNEQVKEDSGLKSDVKSISLLCHTLLDELYASKHFDHTFSKNIGKLKNKLIAFSPKTFVNTHNPELPDALRNGMNELTDEFGKAYVSAYDGAEPIKDWFEPQSSVQADQPSGDAPATQEAKLTDDGRNCAKVFFTLVQTLYGDLRTLRRECKEKGSWRVKQIYENFGKSKNPLGVFLKRCGYRVDYDDISYDGELRNKPDCNGQKIFDLLHNTKQIFGSNSSDLGNLVNLHVYVSTYYEVCHRKHTEKPKAPSSVYHMLRWLCGMRYNAMYSQLRDYVTTLINPPGNVTQPSHAWKYEVDATSTFTALDVQFALLDVCNHAEIVLTSILGHGHSGGIYASDFNTNADGLSYPSNSSQCFDMFVEIVNRVHHQFSFLCEQFYFESTYSSWRDCYYGRDVGGSGWKCNDNLCPNQQCNLRPNQNADQSATQKCNQHPKCGVKSPLQSFLEDGLQGFLPHSISNVGCGVKCTMANHNGIPCKTPMGFSEISVKASHTKNGDYLREDVEKFCGNLNSPLRKVCLYIRCLSPRTPQTLNEMFAFYYGFMHHWGGDGRDHRYTAFTTALKNANFGQGYKELDPTVILNRSKHLVTHSDGDLSSLVSCDGGNASNCGRYLKPLGIDVSGVYSKKHADKYLSWIVYLTETFYDLLKKLYDDCDAKCGNKGSNCVAKCCVKDCSKKSSSQKSSRIHDSRCQSIVTCKSTLPTLSKYGFVFWYQRHLNGDDGLEKKRTCGDFCSALERILGKDSVLIKFIHDIDKFIYCIRFPFMSLLLALWSLSLLYLLHITVVDPLLGCVARKPSAARAVLAAARSGHSCRASLAISCIHV
ncbi:hypothetical protein, conserved [Babesia ovata]|uniref:Uncharacterized protein n=1 Tax=Babesia ovata TaxID=189622 RepID=A0A2H6KHZ6_9APIC|nr:uncharacterized protein BOVATA_041030 [Babesia ovata]GBE62610.1 hypothetical protein, conserved [Babesia ovata]